MKSNSARVLQGDILGLDLGMRWTGVARLNTAARIAEPLSPIDMHKQVLEDEVGLLVSEHAASAVVVGLPRGLDGQDTAQTDWVRDITEKLESHLSVPVFFSDEAGTTKQAEERVKDGQSVDSVAAGIIVEDFAQQVTDKRITDVSF